MSRLPRNYGWLLTAFSVSNLGDGIRYAALPLMAATLSDSPLAVAGMVFASGLPWLMFSLLSGAVVDRLDRRRIMVVVNVLRGVVMACLALLVAFDVASLPALYAAAFLLGVGETLFDTAAGAVVPIIVPVTELERANGYFAVAGTVGNQLAGPAIGGVIFAIAAALPFSIDAASFGVAALCLLMIRGSFLPARDQSEPSNIRSEIAAGLSWLRSKRLLRTMTIITLVIGLTDAAWFAVLVLFVVDVLDLPDAGYGVMVGVGAVGGILAGFIATRITGRLGQAPTLLISLVLGATAQLLLGLTTDVIVAGLMLALSGFALTIWHVVGTSLVQASVPDALMGRVMSVFALASVGGAAVGAIVGGVLAAAFGLRTPFVVGAPIMLGAATLGSRIIRREEISAARLTA